MRIPSSVPPRRATCCGRPAAELGKNDHSPGQNGRVIMKRYTRVGSSLLLFLGILTLAASLAEARVVRFVVEQRQPYAGGAEWGTSGAYERLVGPAALWVNLRDRLNAGIAGVYTAARESCGRPDFA